MPAGYPETQVKKQSCREIPRTPGSFWRLVQDSFPLWIPNICPGCLKRLEFPPGHGFERQLDVRYCKKGSEAMKYFQKRCWGPCWSNRESLSICQITYNPYFEKSKFCLNYLNPHLGAEDREGACVRSAWLSCQEMAALRKMNITSIDLPLEQKISTDLLPSFQI